MQRVKSPKEAFYDMKWRMWGDVIRCSPASRIRREKIISWIKSISGESLLDVGCGNSEFLREIRRVLPALKLSGADISGDVIGQNIYATEGIKFFQLDIDKDVLPAKFDIVVCMEIIEHSSNYRQALNNLLSMTGKYLFLTVPCGSVFPIDRRCGHKIHFKPKEMADLLTDSGLKIQKMQAWGFPFFNLYKHLINIFPESTSRTFLEVERYGWYQKAIAELAYQLFKLCIPRWGYQLFVMAKR